MQRQQLRDVHDVHDVRNLPQGPPVALMPRAPIAATPAMDFPWLSPQALLGMTCGLPTIEPFEMMRRILAAMDLPPGMVVEVCGLPAAQSFYDMLRSNKDVGQLACIYACVTIASQNGQSGYLSYVAIVMHRCMSVVIPCRTRCG